jgi:sec-independent protein translocase protein TatA
MPEIGVPELVIILVIVLIIFGPGKLTGAGSALGQAIREFRRGVGNHKTQTKPAASDQGHWFS